MSHVLKMVILTMAIKHFYGLNFFTLLARIYHFPEIFRLLPLMNKSEDQKEFDNL